MDEGYVLYMHTTELSSVIKKNEITLLAGKCAELGGIISGTGGLTDKSVKYFVMWKIVMR